MLRSGWSIKKTKQKQKNMAFEMDYFEQKTVPKAQIPNIVNFMFFVPYIEHILPPARLLT